MCGVRIPVIKKRILIRQAKPTRTHPERVGCDRHGF